MIEFRQVAPADFALLGEWLSRPHVHRWWNHEFTPEAVERDFGPTARGEEPAEDLLAVEQGRPFGLCQRSRWHDYPDELAAYVPYVAIPPDAMTIDYLIGEAGQAGRGRGTDLVRALAADTFATHRGAGCLIVPVATGNTASWRVLEKAGFGYLGRAEAEPDNPEDPPAQFVYRLDR